MKYKYDSETDILVIKLAKGKPDFGEQSENIITHYNKKGKPIEIEILDASTTTKDMFAAVVKRKKPTVAK